MEVLGHRESEVDLRRIWMNGDFVDERRIIGKSSILEDTENRSPKYHIQVCDPDLQQLRIISQVK